MRNNRLAGKKRSDGSSGRALTALLAAGLMVILAAEPRALQAAAGKGARLEIRLIASADVVAGELIGVRGDIMVVRSGRGERSVGVGEIDTIKVPGTDLRPIGIVAGGIAGGFIGFGLGKKGESGLDPDEKSTQWPLAGLGAVLGGGAGWAAGLLLGKEKVYRIRGMSRDEVDAVLAKLRKKARVPDYK